MKLKKNNSLELEDDLLPEYNFDYSKAMPNKFAELDKRILIELDKDVAEIFNESSKINDVLRAIIKSLPKEEFLPRKKSNFKTEIQFKNY